MAYTTNALVLDIIGPYVDTTAVTGDLPTAEIDAHIAKVDGRIDDRLGGLFYPFNATTATPDTPDTIKAISLNWSVAECLKQIVGVNNLGAMQLAEKHEGMALRDLEWIFLNPDTWMKPETKSAESLTFGSDQTYAWQLQDYEAFLSLTSPLDSGDPPNILPSTVRISAGTGVTNATYMRNGIEFTVAYSPQYQRWVFTALESKLYDGSITGLQVTYNWDYRRQRGAETTTDDGIGAKKLMSQWA